MDIRPEQIYCLCEFCCFRTFHSNDFLLSSFFVYESYSKTFFAENLFDVVIPMIGRYLFIYVTVTTSILSMQMHVNDAYISIEYSLDAKIQHLNSQFKHSRTHETNFSWRRKRRRLETLATFTPISFDTPHRARPAHIPCTILVNDTEVATKREENLNNFKSY